LKSNKIFIVLCALAISSITGTYNFFFQKQEYISKSRLKIELEDKSMGIAGVIPGLDMGADRAYMRTTAVLEEARSTKFINRLFEAYVRSNLKLSPILPRHRHQELIKWFYTTRRNIIDMDKLYKDPRWAEIAGYVAAHVFPTANFDSNTITIEVRTSHKLLSPRLANIAADVLVQLTYDGLKAKVQKLKDFVAKQTTERKKILEALENKHVALQKLHESASTSQFSDTLYKAYNKNVLDFKVLKGSLKTNTEIIKNTREEIEKVKKMITDPSTTNSTLYLSQVQHQLELLQYQKALASSSSELGYEKHLQDIEEKLEEKKKQYNEIIKKSSVNGLVYVKPTDYVQNLERTVLNLREERKKIIFQMRSLKAQIEIDKRQIATLPDILQKFSRLQRQIKVSSNLYLGLQEKLQEVEIMEAGITNDLKVSERAPSVGKSVGLPWYTRLVLSAVIGLLLAIIILILKNTLIHTVRNFKELQSLGITVIGEIPIIAGLAPPLTSFLGKKFERVFGTDIDDFSSKINNMAKTGVSKVEKIAPSVSKFVPKMKSIRNNMGLQQKKDQSELVVLDKPNSPEADIFRYMRLRMSSFIEKKFPDKKGKVILVTSPTEANGKTFVSSNLSASFGKGEAKTLLVDLDLRNSSISRAFKGMANTPGIETILSKSTRPEDQIVSISNYFDVLFCKPGVENPTEVLESHALREFIERQRENYDYIFLDSPPVLAVCDPSLIAPMVDLVLLVAAYEITFKEDIQLALDGLNAGRNHPVLGILNMVDKGFDRYSYGYSYYPKAG
jgi:capsular exopolysaccharide synthesis family protein